MSIEENDGNYKKWKRCRDMVNTYRILGSQRERRKRMGKTNTWINTIWENPYLKKNSRPHIPESPWTPDRIN